MKNLLDELHKLDEVEYSVSNDFSKKVVSKINKGNKIIVLKRVTSVAMVACLAGFAVFMTNKLGILDRINKASSNSMSLSMDSMTMMESIDVDEKTQGEIKKEEMMLEGVATEAVDELEELPLENYADERTTKELPKQASEPQSVPEVVNSVNDSLIVAKSAARTYSKQMKLDDYISDIHKALNDYNIENEIIADNKIEIHTNNINQVYDVIENYTDARLELNDEKIILVVEY